MNENWIAPSILAADFSRLGEEVRAVLAAGADMIHFDVMDNHYVPNLTVGPLVCEGLRRSGIDAFIDAHLMVEPVDGLAAMFAEAGASLISVHPQSTKDLDRTLDLILEGGCRAGIALNPETEVDVIESVLDRIDLVLIMSVDPGFGGQSFIESSFDKIARARQLIDACARPIRLEVDGGIKIDNIGAVAAAGADTFVAGTAIFGAPDYAGTIAAMRREIARVTAQHRQHSSV